MRTVQYGDMKVPLNIWDEGVPMERGAIDQMVRTCQLPFVVGAALMPDGHIGIGSCVGAVVATSKAIVPAITGVDIGCGMMATRTSLSASDLPDSLSTLRELIERAVPHGRTNDGKPGDRGAWNTAPNLVMKKWGPLEERFKAVVSKHPKAAARTTVQQLGTLGSGNHFIELCLDTDNRVWIMLHSGSRGLGNRFGSYFIEMAKEDIYKAGVHIVDKDLAYFEEGTTHFTDYFEAVLMAQDFARVNRELMMHSVLDAMKASGSLPEFKWDLEAVNCHHNYVEKEVHSGKSLYVTRKGAVRAQLGDMGIIPGSMGAKSFIVRGKGNTDSYTSCSHGAGRVMSRGQAKRTITMDDHLLATAGVECRKDMGVLDESPAAYKDIDLVIAAQSDLVDIVYTLKQLLCIKG
jgi:tRNA-splicing ligase RtcB (3'-phosphate/5'-hydroxy nucleic acid ligase)